MKKKIMAILGLAIAGVLCAGGVIVCHRLYCNQLNLLKEYQKSTIPGIVCIGDSLTHGTDNSSYPEFLQEMLAEEQVYVNAVNLGVGGENTVTIAGRMGAIPFQVQEFVIPENTEPVEIHFVESENKPIRPMYQGDTGINPCVIVGVQGRLYSEIHEDRSATYYFQRSNAGEEVSVPTGSEVCTAAKLQYQAGIFVVFMGENNGFDDVDDLIAQQQAILALQTVNSGKYLILGLTSGTADERVELEQKMLETYGDHYINLREYMSTVGPEVAGVTITKTDREQMERGMVPECLRADAVHYNKEGYRLVAKLVYERLIQLGYLDEIDAVTKQYSSFWNSINW